MSEQQQATNKGRNAKENADGKGRGGRGRRRQHNKLQKGLVKACQSGDTIVVWSLESLLRQDKAKKKANTLLNEIEITISGVRAPMLARSKKDGYTKDEPCAFEAREFLRNKLIGKTVTFTIEHTTTSPLNPKNQHNFGLVYLGQEDIRESLVKNGMVSVISKFTNDTFARLRSMEEKARSAGIGLHKKNAKPRPLVIDFSPIDLLSSKKEQHVPAIVENVRSGSLLTVYLPDTHHLFNLQLSGAQSPPFYYAKTDEEQLPHARPAKLFSEMKVLNRDVTIVLESIDNRRSKGLKQLYGTVICSGLNLAVALLKEGYAEFVEWSAGKVKDINALRNAEKEARAGRKNIWRKKSGGARGGKNKSLEFEAEVVGIINAGTIRVLRRQQDKEVEMALTLSSVLPPRLIPYREMNDPNTPKEVRDEACWAFQAKEFLRKDLIGKTVTCVLDYTRTLEHSGSDKAYWSVYKDGKNIALGLIKRGYCKVVPHGNNDPRSPEYQDFVVAQSKAKKGGLGILGSGKRTPNVRVNDLTSRDQAKNAESFFRFLKEDKAGDLSAVVEYVFSGSRFKLWIPKESCVISFGLAGVRSEKTIKTSEKPAQYDPNRCLGNYAMAWVRDRLFQRDVTVRITAVDKGGNFLGRLFFEKEDFAVKVLKEGLGQTFGLRDQDFKEEYEEAQAGAQKKKKNMWKDYDAKAEAEKERKRLEAIAAKKKEEEKPREPQHIKLTVTEIIDGETFFFQPQDSGQATFETMNKAFSQVDFDQAPTLDTPKQNMLCAAQFSHDQTWYRAKIERINKQDNTAFVRYIDYGNAEDLPFSKIKQLDEQKFGLDACPPRACLGKLAFVKVPKGEREFARDAILYLRDLIFDKPGVPATVQYTEQHVYRLLVDDGSGEELGASLSLVKSGLATVKARGARGAKQKALVQQLIEEQNKAKRSRLRIWQYGEAPDSDEEQEL